MPTSSLPSSPFSVLAVTFFALSTPPSNQPLAVDPPWAIKLLRHSPYVLHLTFAPPKKLAIFSRHLEAPRPTSGLAEKPRFVSLITLLPSPSPAATPIGPDATPAPGPPSLPSAAAASLRLSPLSASWPAEAVSGQAPGLVDGGNVQRSRFRFEALCLATVDRCVACARGGG